MINEALKRYYKYFFIFILLSIAVLTIYVFHSVREYNNAVTKHTELHAFDKLSDSTRDVVSSLEQYLEDKYDAMEVLAQQLSDQDHIDFSQRFESMDDLIEDEHFIAVGYAGTDGLGYCTTCHEVEEVASIFPNIADCYDRGMRVLNMQAQCGDISMIGLAVPIIKDTAIIGVVYCGIDPSTIVEFLPNDSFDGALELFLADDEGNLLYKNTGSTTPLLGENITESHIISVPTKDITIKKIGEDIKNRHSRTCLVSLTDTEDNPTYMMYIPLSQKGGYLFSFISAPNAQKTFDSSMKITSEAFYSSVLSYVCIVVLFVIVLSVILYLIKTEFNLLLNRQQEEIKELEYDLTNARITNFTSQMQPHFLYNALSSIREIILFDPEYASDLIYDFTTHLRACIRSIKTDDPIAFSMELSNIQAYVNIEKMRFGDRLKVVYDIETEDFNIVPLTLQPLVENAIRHGIYQRGKDGGTVTIKTRSISSYDPKTKETNRFVLLTIMDDGVGFDYQKYVKEMESGQRDSTGLKNLKFRLETIQHAKIDIQSQIGVGTTFTITIPIEEKNI